MGLVSRQIATLDTNKPGLISSECQCHEKLSKGFLYDHVVNSIPSVLSKFLGKHSQEHMLQYLGVRWSTGEDKGLSLPEVSLSRKTESTSEQEDGATMID